MGARICKMKIINNRGNVNVGDYCNLSPLGVQKVYAGAGGASIATFLNGKRMQPETPRTPEFFPPLETSELTLGS
ncbi:spore germination protein [Bacillus cytotoxicus]|nr:spore germination protein [Bacillus cereus group sp. BfR-BA-01492]EMA6342564.1 spore germination protein [Bacillus cytotoxicus]